MTPAAPAPVAVFSALGDETRWAILGEIGKEELSASALANRLPVSRQAIAKHLAALQAVGLITSRTVGREVLFSALGSELRAVARRLDAIGNEWDRRLDRIKQIAESL
jgi:DNA-binding transcriptional ArsR family regulator